MAQVLVGEILHLAEDYGINHMGFLTLTFADDVKSIKEAQRRFNSLNTHVLRDRYERGIGVWERMKSRRIHFHLVVVLKDDIRSGFDFADIERYGGRKFPSAGNAIRAEWKFWRATAAKYGFGRTELLPVKSNADGIARYLGKYVSKHVSQREDGDKGARVVRFLGFKPGQRRWTSRFAWNNDKAKLWRLKVAEFGRIRGIHDMRLLRVLYTHRWAWFMKDAILTTPLPAGTVFPSFSMAEEGAAERQTAEGNQARLRAALVVARMLAQPGGYPKPDEGKLPVPYPWRLPAWDGVNISWRLPEWARRGGEWYEECKT